LFDNYPGLFAVFHARHRLLTPRHPPCALNSLTTNIQSSSADLRLIGRLTPPARRSNRGLHSLGEEH
jgi:hypothetical protein